MEEQIDYQSAFQTKRDAFLAKVNKSARLRSSVFKDEFTSLSVDAVSGDAVSQDLIAYFFKKGYLDLLPENYEMFMKWEILAVANGNFFAIDKLSMFLNFAIDKIVYVDDLPAILHRNKIDETNYVDVLSKLVCEGIVDELNIDALSLSKESLSQKQMTPALMHIFEKARDNATVKVLAYLRS